MALNFFKLGAKIAFEISGLLLPLLYNILEKIFKSSQKLKRQVTEHVPYSFH